MRIEEELESLFRTGLQQVRTWFKSENKDLLQSIFNHVGFIDRKILNSKTYCQPSLASTFSKPIKSSKGFHNHKEETLALIGEKYKGLSDSFLEDLNERQLYYILEDCSSNVPIEGDDSTSVFDYYKMKAAKIAIGCKFGKDAHPGYVLINIDLSGIQLFIYNLSSSGAMKNLRSRSFFIELICHHLVDLVMTEFELHPANVIVNGGGNFIILAGKEKGYKERLNLIDEKINKWLWSSFAGRLYASFSAVEVAHQSLESDLSDDYQKLQGQSFAEKRRKFNKLINSDSFAWIEKNEPALYSCEICQVDVMRPLNAENVRCSICERLTAIGNKLPQARFIYELDEPKGKDCIQISSKYYLISEMRLEGERLKWVNYSDRKNIWEDLGDGISMVFLQTNVVKNEDLPEILRDQIKNRKKSLKRQLKGQDLSIAEKKNIKDEISTCSMVGIAMTENLVKYGKGAQYLAALRMDVDNMGTLVSRGFRDGLTINKLAALSRSMNNFFKIYLHDLCYTTEYNVKRNRYLHVLYAGGDDMFAIGWWDDVARFAIEVGERFREYTGRNIDISLSGGFTIHPANFPVHQMAKFAKRALEHAKANTEECWECREGVSSCPLYKDGECKRKASFVPFYTDRAALRKLNLDQDIYRRYAENQSRLTLALKWQIIDPHSKEVNDEVEKFLKSPMRDFDKLQKSRATKAFLREIFDVLEIWYEEGTLYLPKISWILSRFKKKLPEGKKDILFPIYANYLHGFDPRKFSTFRMPIIWQLLSSRMGGRYVLSTSRKKPRERVESKYSRRHRR